MIKNIEKVLFGTILIATLFTYFEILTTSFNISTLNLYTVRFIVFGLMLYNLINFHAMFRYIFKKAPDYWTKSRKENQAILKKRNKKYSLKEKITSTLYFAIYVLMLILLCVFILFNLNIINIITIVGVLGFVIDTSISVYKML